MGVWLNNVYMVFLIVIIWFFVVEDMGVVIVGFVICGKKFGVYGIVVGGLVLGVEFNCEKEGFYYLYYIVDLV